jgi:uncharacterized protein involved in exopolysaccharide biosynthesis
MQQPDPLEVAPHAVDHGSGPYPTDYLGFALGAVRRRRRLAAGVFLGVLSATAAFYLLQPPRYRAEARIMALRQQALPSVVRSSMTEDRPTAAAWETIHRRENLVQLIEAAGLLNEPRAGEPLDRLRRTTARFAEVFVSDDDPLERLIRQLDRQLKVEADEVTINLELEWTDPQQAYRIVEGALQNFLEARHVQEVTALDESIAILRGRAAVLHAELEKVTEDTRRGLLQDAARPPGPQLAAVAPVPVQSPSEELVRLRSMLEAKERAVGDVEDFRRRRLAELQAQYESRRSIYAETHPEMVNLRLDIATLSKDSTQITALRAEERRLREELQARQAKEPQARPPIPLVVEPAPRQATDGINASLERSERVREARSRYEEVMESVNRAQLQLDTARSEFKHRYKILWPVQVPKKPISPNPWKIFGAGTLASLLLAFLAAAALDWRSGTVLERWQIERGLGIPVIWERPR